MVQCPQVFQREIQILICDCSNFLDKLYSYNKAIQTRFAVYRHKNIKNAWGREVNINIKQVKQRSRMQEALASYSPCL